MTDYLEALLDEQEQEEHQPALTWKQPLSLLPIEKSAQDKHLPNAKSSQVNQNEAGIAKKVTQSIQRGIDSLQKATSAPLSDPARQGSQAAETLTTEIVRLRRAVRQASAQISHRKVSDTNAVTGGCDISRDSIGSLLSGTANYAALVDAAFARDARRYDGPLGLL